MKSGIIYNGPSQLTARPLWLSPRIPIAIARPAPCCRRTYLRADVNPLEASKTGADYSICGACPMRGETTTDPKRKIAKGRRCYVNLGQGVLIVYKAFLRGVYQTADTAADRKALGRGRVVRVGTYGDPAACPDHVWTDLIADAQTWTAYTHQKPWRPDIAMQSADNYAEAKTHWAAGRRTFRVITGLDQLDWTRRTRRFAPRRKRPAHACNAQACKLVPRVIGRKINRDSRCTKPIAPRRTSRGPRAVAHA
jgi:hypothetical protein